MSAEANTEINIDALVGPTHHFGGLGVGNVASQQHAHQVSRPRDAALEGLRKAQLIASLGIPQFLFLPPARPRLDLLQSLGFEGDWQQQLDEAFHTARHILSAAFSSAFMWAANSATVAAAADAADHRLHITPANLISSWHRASEAIERGLDLHDMFNESVSSRLHPPLSAIVPLRDEGAANHMRLCEPTGQLGFNVFVYGAAQEQCLTARFPARQTRAACEAIARRHLLDSKRTVFLQQHPQAIAAGVFHNDVIATSHQNLLIHHQLAFDNAARPLSELEADFQSFTGSKLIRIEVPARDMSLEDAVRSYFFNSQIVCPDRNNMSSDRPKMVLICPQQCQEIASARQLIERLVAAADCPIEDVHFVPLGQSMAGGGGPACLRLRVPLRAAEVARLPPQLRVTERLVDTLTQAIERWYPETLEMQDFCEPGRAHQLIQVSGQLRRVADCL